MYGSLITAMVTPFLPDDSINLDLAVKLAQHLVSTGSDALVLSGTTGESPTLTHAEEESLYQAVLNAVDCPIIAGTGSNCTRTAIASTQRAKQLGVHASLQVVPYYNKPSQDGVLAHFSAIADSVDLPLILYNIPSRTGVTMTPETIIKLAKHVNIVGIKEATGHCDDMPRLRDNTASDFLIYSGDDALTLPALAAGATGVVSVAAHIVGSYIQAMITAYKAQDDSVANQINTKLMPLFKALFITTNPVPIKAALTALNWPVGLTRLPLVPLCSEEKTHLISELSALNLL